MDMKRLAAAGHRGGGGRAGALRPRALGRRLPRLDAGHPALVHQPAALVGPSHPGLLLRGLRPPHGGRGRRRPRCEKCGGPVRHEEDVLDTWFSSALWPFATLGWPEETPRARGLLSHHGALHRPRHHLPVGGAHDHDGPGVHGRRPLHATSSSIPTVLAADGRRMSKSLGTGRRPAGAHRRLRRRRHPLRPGLHELGAGRALQRRAHRDGPQLRQQDLERLAPGPAGRRSAGRAAGGAGHRRPTAGSSAGWRPSARRSPASTRATSSTTWPGCSTASSGTRCATGTWRWPRPASTAKTRPSGWQVSGNLLVLLEQVMVLLHPLMPFVTEEIYGYLPQVRVRATRPASLFDAALSRGRSPTGPTRRPRRPWRPSWRWWPGCAPPARSWGWPRDVVGRVTPGRG